MRKVMWFLVAGLVSGAGGVACSERAGEAVSQQGADRGALPAPPTAPELPREARSGEAAAAPTPVKPAVAAPTVDDAGAGMSAPEPDDKTLERSPGLTPVLPLVKVPTPAVVAGLAGAPGESPAMGPLGENGDPLVKVFVFSDFQCPVCRRAVEPLKKLARTFPEDVQVIFKHHALVNHARAEAAARASIAAFRQGRFWELHDLLFEGRQLDDASLRAAAERVGLDLARFDQDYADPAAAAQVAYESAQAQALDAPGTPAFFINGARTVGWGSYLGIESQVRRAVEQARAMLGEGVPRGEVAYRMTAAENAEAARILFGR